MSRTTYNVRLDDRGRLVLPADLRKRAGLSDGDALVLIYEEGVIRLAKRRDLARLGRGMFADAARRRKLVDELIDERRYDAHGETGSVESKQS